jgi:hypothetical protein
MVICIYRLMVFSRQATNDPEILTPDLKNRPHRIGRKRGLQSVLYLNCRYCDRSS